MVDKRALQSVLGTIDNTVGGIAFGTVVPANMRRYIYKIKTVNQFNGANQLQFGHQTAPAAGVIVDYIDHVLIHDMWNDPDELKEDSLPIYIIPAGSQLWGLASAAGDIYVYIEYEDSE